MTRTHPQDGTHRRPQPLLRRWTAILLATVAVLACLGAGGQAAGQPPGELVVTLRDQTSFVGPDDVFTIAVEAAGLVVPGAQLTLEVFPATRSRAAFDRSTRGEELGRPLTSTTPVPVDQLLDASGLIRASFPVAATTTPAFGIRLPDAGVYPARLVLRQGDGVEAALLTYLVRLPRAGQDAVPLAVATIVGVDAGLVFDVDGAPQVDPSDLTAIDAATEALAAAPRTAASVLARPETLDALALLDASGTERVAALTGALGGRQLVAQTYAPVDIGAWTEAGLTDPRAAEELGSQFQSGSAVAASVTGRTPSPDVWVADGSLTPLAITRLRFAGATRLVVPDVLLEPADERTSSASATRPFELLDREGVPMPTAQIDVALGARLTATGDPALDAHRTLAEVAVVALADPREARGVVLAVPTAQGVPAPAYRILLTALGETAPADAAPVLAAVTLDDLFRLVPPARTGTRSTSSTVRRDLRPVEVATLGALPAEVAATRARVSSVRSLLGPTSRVPDPLDRQLLVAQSDRMDQPTALRYLDAIDAVVDETVAGISVPETQQVTLTSVTGRIPLTFENRLSDPARVRLELSSDKLEFPDGAVVEVDLPAGATTTVDVPVEARASGAFPLDLVVRTPDDGITIGSARLTVRSTAISGVGLVLSIGAGLFLLLWWASHFRRVRRRQSLVATPHPSRGSPTGPLPPGPGATGPSATLPAGAAGGAADEGEHVRSPHRH